MWEEIMGILSSSSTPWIIGILSAIITGWWALKKLRYEKRLEKFKETNENLFKERKQEVLAAIATLSIFKRDPEFEKNTIDVLLSRLYTELDYDIINSILTTLIQDSDRDELLYIADGLQDINRNFFVQEHPMKQRVNDVDAAAKLIESSEKNFQTKEYHALLKEGRADTEIFIRNKEEVMQKYKKDFHELIAIHKYKLKWHKQVTADAYAMFLRKAYLANRKGELIVRLFQNDFNYVYMAEVKTTTTCIARSALSNATFAEVDFNKIEFRRNDFYASRFYQCGFRGGTIKTTFFETNQFEEVVFENVLFEKTGFLDCIFIQTSFINCSGLTQDNFVDSRSHDSKNIFPAGIIIESKEKYEQRIQTKKPSPPAQ